MRNVPRTQTIILELNRNLTKEVTIEFNDLPEAINIKLEELYKITINNVPNEVEDALSRMIFNRVEIHQLQEDNKTYAFQIINHLPYHSPRS